MTLWAFLKSYLILKIEKMLWKIKKNLIFLNKKTNTFFFWEYAIYYWLINEKKKPAKNRHRPYIFS